MRARSSNPDAELITSAVPPKPEVLSDEMGPRFGINLAMLTGMMLMPLVVATGFLTHRPDVPAIADTSGIGELRQTLDPADVSPAASAARPAGTE